MNIVQAQHARQVLDVIVGYKISPVLWKYIVSNTINALSAGRCQTPALRLVYDNQQDIDNSPGKKAYDTIGYFTKYNLDFKLNHCFEKEDVVADYLEDNANWDHTYNITKPN